MGRVRRMGGTIAGSLMVLGGVMGPGATQGGAQLTGDWHIEAAEHRYERFQGREALYLDRGSAWLEGASIQNGSIRFDLHAPDVRGFYGVGFRVRDERNYESIYIRPFQSGNPDATQYTPVHNGNSGWQIYTPPRFSGPLEIPTDRWIAVEVRFRDGMAELYVEGERIAFPELQHPVEAGGIRITSSGAPGRFANVVVSDETPPAIEAPPLEPEEIPRGLIREWQLSEPFAEDRLALPGNLPSGLGGSGTPATVGPDFRGIVDIARSRSRSPEANTVLAEFTLRADTERAARMEFGFSDRVVVYLNGRPLYRGHDEWISRDYRFLGTMGLFDEVILPLEAGENRVTLAVSEGFGGWGVMARLLDAEGLEVVGR